MTNVNPNASTAYRSYLQACNTTDANARNRMLIERNLLAQVPFESLAGQITMQLRYNREIKVSDSMKQADARRIQKHVVAVYPGMGCFIKDTKHNTSVEIRPLTNQEEIDTKTGKPRAIKNQSSTGIKGVDGTVNNLDPNAPTAEQLAERLASTTAKLESTTDTNKDLQAKVNDTNKTVEAIKKQSATENGIIKSELQQALDTIEQLKLENAKNVEEFTALKAMINDPKKYTRKALMAKCQ